MPPTDEGAFTVDISDKVLAQEEAQFVLIGTPQDRALCLLKGHSLQSKCTTALKGKIPPFICLAETWQEHEDGLSKQILSQQLKAVVEGIPVEELKGLHIIYNAVWINDSLWKVTEEILEKSYIAFKEVVEETLDPSIHGSLHLIPAVPTRCEKLSEIASIMQRPSYAFAGLSLGTIRS